MEFFTNNIIPGEVFVQLIAFLIVFFTLRKLAWGPIQQALAARREKIKNDFDEIENAKQEIEKLKAEYANHLQKIDDESRAKLQEAIDEGKKIAKEIEDKAREEATSTFEQSKQNLNLEVEKARIQLREEIANLSLQVAEKVMQEKLSDDFQQEKILAMVEELESVVEQKGGK